MPPEPSVEQLVERWRRGDHSAAEQLYRRYWRRLYRLADQQLDKRLGARLSADDILQSAFRSFFRRVALGQYAFDDSSGLWRLLEQITMNKIRKQVAHHRAAKRDVGREAPGGTWGCEDPVARGPLPEEAAILLDELDALRAAIAPPDFEIVCLSLEGLSTQDIARKVRCSRWTVRRVLARVEDYLQRQASADPGDDVSRKTRE